MIKSTVFFAKKHILIFLFFLSYMIFSFVSFRTYGITYDESFVYNRANALYTHLLTDNVDPNISYSLLFQSSPLDVNIYYNNTYGMILRIFNPKSDYVIFHLYNLLFASVIFLASYALLYSVFKKQKYAILGPLFILLSPVFFGHIPVNPKDMPFAVFYFLSLTFIYFFGKKRSLFSIIVLGLFFGLTQSGRIIGFALYPTFILYRLYLFFTDKKQKNIREFFLQELFYFLLIFIVAAFVMTVTWPYMGSSFFKHFLKMFLISKNFPWEGKIFFQGIMYAAKSVPRTFIPTLLLIQTPLFILVMMLVSLIFIKKEQSRKIYFLFWLTLVLNLFLYLALKPVSFIRHYLYLFPVFASIAAVGCVDLFENLKDKRQKGIFFILVFASIVYVSFQIIQLFPYGYIYYNELVGGTARARKSYEIDLWAQSNKEAVLWLANYTKNTGKTNKVYACGNNFTASYFFPSWLKLVQKVNQADYMICSNIYGDEDKKINGIKLHEVSRQGVPVNVIYKSSNIKESQ